MFWDQNLQLEDIAIKIHTKISQEKIKYSTTPNKVIIYENAPPFNPEIPESIYPVVPDLSAPLPKTQNDGPTPPAVDGNMSGEVSTDIPTNNVDRRSINLDKTFTDTQLTLSRHIVYQVTVSADTRLTDALGTHDPTRQTTAIKNCTYRDQDICLQT